MSAGTDQDASVPASAHRPAKLRRILSLVICLLIAILILREAGFLNLDFYSSRLAAETGSQVTTSRTSSDQEVVDLSTVSFVPDVTLKEDTALVKAGGDALRKVQVAGYGEHKGQLAVSLEKADVKGLYWLPLYKRAQVSYAETFTLGVQASASSVSINGRVQGQIDCAVTGACSVYKFRQLVAQEISAEMEKAIRSQLLKE